MAPHRLMTARGASPHGDTAEDARNSERAELNDVAEEPTCSAHATNGGTAGI